MNKLSGRFKKISCVFAAVILTLCFAAPIAVSADSPTDEIENYNIKVNMRNDGTMDIIYHINWKVLDDTSEGPLTWVKIGIPNSHVDEIKALSDNIDKIDYYDEDGDYVRIDFRNSYHANEIVSFDFSIHQAYMYKLDHSTDTCGYEFTPGWFDNIDVKSLTILWNDENVQSSTAKENDDGYLKWVTSLSAGDRFTVSVEYNGSTFTTNEDEQRSDSEDSDPVVGAFIAAAVGIVITILVIIFRGKGGGYRGGFGTGIYHGGTHGCACASSCACACACACAGGGRAGCTAKNLYGAIVNTEELKGKLDH